MITYLDIHNPKKNEFLIGWIIKFVIVNIINDFDIINEIDTTY